MYKDNDDDFDQTVRPDNVSDFERARRAALQQVDAPVDVSADAVLDDDTRPCPACAEPIRNAAVLCRFCKTDLRQWEAAHRARAPEAQQLAGIGPSVQAPPPSRSPSPAGPQATQSNNQRVLASLLVAVIASSVLVAIYFKIKSGVEEQRAKDCEAALATLRASHSHLDVAAADYHCGPTRAAEIAALDPDRQQQAAAATAESEARDTVAVLRALYPPAIGIASESAKVDHCHDEAIGFDKLAACASSVAPEIVRLSKLVPAKPIATTPCGREVEGALRSYMTAHMNYRAATFNWFTEHKAELGRLMVGRTFPDVADQIKDPEPNEWSDAYGPGHPASWGSVMKVECTKRLFTCTQEANVCWINKVADRLGLSAESKVDQPLYVRGTQILLN